MRLWFIPAGIAFAGGLSAIWTCPPGAGHLIFYLQGINKLQYLGCPARLDEVKMIDPLLQRKGTVDGYVQGVEVG